MSQNLLIFSNIELILIGLIILLFLIQLFYFLLVYARPLREIKKIPAEKTTIFCQQPIPVSVIVYNRGNADDLRNNLPAILTQDYPEYEVIVVNDGSDADSEDVLKLFSADYKHLYYTYVPVYTHNTSHKKLALTMGIKAAKHEILLFTESNCRPLSPQWIKKMTACYTPETDICLGFCAYLPDKGFMNKLIGYDNLMNGLQYLSSAMAKRSYTGNGRNLSYRKELFYVQKENRKSLNLPVGDNDLAIHNTVIRNKTKTEISTDSILELTKDEDYNSWREMKLARAIAQQSYEKTFLSLFRLETCSYMLFQLVALISIIAGIFGNWIIAVLAGTLSVFRFITKAFIFRKSALMLRQKPSTSYLFILEMILPLFNTYIEVYRIFRKKYGYASRI